MEGLKIEEVAVWIGVSTQTINRWYKFKRENPNNKTSKALPAYKVLKSGNNLPLRIWNEKDMKKLEAFKSNMVKGRNGKMGLYEGKGTSNGKKKNSRSKSTDTK